jgi:cytoskeletal protein RodZ
MDNILNTKEEYAKSLGDKIKFARMELDIDQQLLSNELKISVDIINGLERGDITEGQRAYFTRLICLKILKRLNIENDDNIYIVDQVYPNSAKNVPNATASKENINFGNHIKKRNTKSSMYGIIKYLAITLFLGLLAVTLFYFLSVNVKNVNSQTKNETTLMATTTLVPNEIITPKPVTEVAFKQKSNTTYTYGIKQLANPDSYKLTITFTGDCYVDVYDVKTKKSIVPAKTYKSGEKLELTITGGQDVVVSLGATQNATITVDETDINIKDQAITGKSNIEVYNDIK